MEPTTDIPNWMEDPSVQGIPREKLAFLSQLYQQGQGKSQKEMMSFLMPMMAQAKQKGLTFTQRNGRSRWPPSANTAPRKNCAKSTRL